MARCVPIRTVPKAANRFQVADDLAVFLGKCNALNNGTLLALLAVKQQQQQQQQRP